MTVAVHPRSCPDVAHSRPTGPESPTWGLVAPVQLIHWLEGLQPRPQRVVVVLDFDFDKCTTVAMLDADGPTVDLPEPVVIDISWLMARTATEERFDPLDLTLIYGWPLMRRLDLQLALPSRAPETTPV